jgi:hypothetical protein
VDLDAVVTWSGDLAGVSASEVVHRFPGEHVAEQVDRHEDGCRAHAR